MNRLLLRSLIRETLELEFPKFTSYTGKAYHYTNEQNAMSILENGFVPYEGLGGVGVYCVMQPLENPLDAGKRFVTHVVEFNVDLPHVVVLGRLRETARYEDDPSIDAFIIDRGRDPDYLILRNLESIADLRISESHKMAMRRMQ